MFSATTQHDAKRKTKELWTAASNESNCRHAFDGQLLKSSYFKNWEWNDTNMKKNCENMKSVYLKFNCPQLTFYQICVLSWDIQGYEFTSETRLIENHYSKHIGMPFRLEAIFILKQCIYRVEVLLLEYEIIYLMVQILYRFDSEFQITFWLHLVYRSSVYIDSCSS